MASCLVQQLFRQKIGKELDQGIVDEVLFPMLRLRKHLPKDLLQDIKLATDTLIITRQAGHFSVPTFTPIPEYWTYAPAEEQRGHLTSGSVSWPLDKKLKGKFPFWISVGQRTSKVRRKKIRKEDWGTIDILNELRGLNYPQAGYKPRSYVIEEPVDSFDDAYISLAEDNSLPATIRWGVDHSRYNAVLIDGRSQFVKNFLDDVLITGKRLTWCPPDPGRLGWGILSIVESSQHGEVQIQLN